MSAENKQRLDAVLVARGWASGREKAKELIAGGSVQVNGRTVTKAALLVSDTDALTCDNSSQRYVGRGGYKLEKAIAEAGLTLSGVCAMDVGASTGGFTDCMLQHGAARVYAVDVGHGQLHPSLCADERVTDLSGTDIRDAEKTGQVIPRGTVNFCSVDVSFISIQSIFAAILPFLAPGATLVCLIKPQFEAGRAAIGKNGVVKDPKAHRRVLEETIRFWSAFPCRLECLTFSPIAGGEGNVEYLAVLTYQPSQNCTPRAFDIAALVRQAQATVGKK